MGRDHVIQFGLRVAKIEEESGNFGGDAWVLDVVGGDRSGEVGGSVGICGTGCVVVMFGNAVRTLECDRGGTGEVPVTLLGTMDKSEGKLIVVMEVCIEPRRDGMS